MRDICPELRKPVETRGFAEEGTKDRAAGDCNSQARLATGPDGDVGRGVEEVVFVAEGMKVWDADDCRYGSSESGSLAMSLVSEGKRAYIAPIARMRMSGTFSFRPIWRDQTRITGKIENTRSPAQVKAE